MIGAQSRSALVMFVVLRDIVVVIGGGLLLGWRCTKTTPPFDEQHESRDEGLGVVCALLPIAQSFWTIAVMQTIFHNDDEPLGVAVGQMAPLLADPTLGELMVTVVCTARLQARCSAARSSSSSCDCVDESTVVTTPKLPAMRRRPSSIRPSRCRRHRRPASNSA